MAPKSASAKQVARGAARISKRLIWSYVWDWICILAIAGVGGAFNRIKSTNHRAFALQDPSISYPYFPDTVSVAVMLVVGFLAPLIITFVLTFLLVPGGAAPKGTPRALIWRRRLWEWNTAWMGLALSLASAFMITEGLKDLAGKPRPHMLALCDPDLNNIAQYQVGGLGKSDGLFGGAVPIMVDYRICRQTDPHELRNMFASWPSGHSSFSWAGLLYLSLWASSKFAVTIPYLNPTATTQKRHDNPTFGDLDDMINSKPIAERTSDSGSTEYNETHPDVLLQNHGNPPRNQAAAAPVYLLILTFFPIGTATFIAVSRWFDYHHHGFDIITGSLLGMLTAWFSFRFYHLPVRRGAGWSWGARTRGRAFWLGVGRDTYVGSEGWGSESSDTVVVSQKRDIESGQQASRDGQSQEAETMPGPSQL